MFPADLLTSSWLSPGLPIAESDLVEEVSLEVTPLPDGCRKPPSSSPSMDPLCGDILPGLDIVVPCSACSNTYRKG